MLCLIGFYLVSSILCMSALIYGELTDVGKITGEVLFKAVVMSLIPLWQTAVLFMAIWEILKMKYKKDVDAFMKKTLWEKE